MTKTELVEEVRQGRRIKVEYSMFESTDPSKCPASNHVWRVIVCTDVDDVLECRKCGVQQVSPCNFDEDYS